MNNWRSLLLAATVVLPPAGSLHAAPSARTCADKEVIEFVLDAFNYTQLHELKSGLKMASIADVRDLGLVRPAQGRWREIRGCAGKGQLVDGTTIDLWYQVVLPRTGEADDYRVPVCFARHGSRTQGDCRRRFSRSPAAQ